MTGNNIMKHLLTPRALLLASALAIAPAAYAETPADTLVVATDISDSTMSFSA